jgi:3-oxoacyl-[acyl-carrier protein] reductase
MPKPLSYVTELVTGANHGIGAATALALADRGADLAITYLRTGDPGRSDEYNTARSSDASDVREAIETPGCRCHLIEADLADADTPRRLFDEVEAELGSVSVLVHNTSTVRRMSHAGRPVLTGDYRV